MESKHTKGPWHVDIVDHPPEYMVTVRTKENKLLLEMDFAKCELRRDAIADAYLISAAPELLAFARHYLDSESTTSECDRMAKLALAKAEGK